TFTFELLDTNKSGVVAYLWRESPFLETPMSGSGNSFSITVNDFTVGETIFYACKFAFAGGLAVTQYFSYVVGDDCALSYDQLSSSNQVFIYPNPADKEVFVSMRQGSIDSLELYTINGFKIKKATATDRLHVDELAIGLYLIKVYQNGRQSFHRIIIE
ncbi:MAG: T9SS type A sorting domain-containing protein, partial [Bacteroidota bacterium]|nr:T9SS type A sorting domain-containing protein [Bacteroidota bacterium]